MTTWQWSEMKPHPRKATAKSGSPARAATVLWEMSILTVGVTTGKLSLEEAHGESYTF